MPSGKKKKVWTKNPSLSSVLTRNALMRMAGPVYFGRGEGYFNSSMVGGLVELDGRITAKVRGTRTYKVGLWAERGVKSFSNSPGSRLMEFPANEYHRAKRHEDAIKQIWVIFVGLIITGC